MSVIDPAPAIARHLGDLLDAGGLAAHRDRSGHHVFFTSGDAEAFRAMMLRLTGVHGTVHTRHEADGLHAHST